MLGLFLCGLAKPAEHEVLVCSLFVFLFFFVSSLLRSGASANTRLLQIVYLFSQISNGLLIATKMR